MKGGGMKYAIGWREQSGWLERKRERRRVAFCLVFLAVYILGCMTAVHFRVW